MSSTKQIDNLIAEVITRTMRQGGFYGDVHVKNVRSRKDGSYSATVNAVVGGGLGRAKYRALVKDGKVKVDRSSPVTIHRPGQPVRQMG